MGVPGVTRAAKSFRIGCGKELSESFRIESILWII
jgi:hypothetical protein